jgi:hypothetical protein
MKKRRTEIFTNWAGLEKYPNLSIFQTGKKRRR